MRATVFCPFKPATQRERVCAADSCAVVAHDMRYSRLIVPAVHGWMPHKFIHDRFPFRYADVLIAEIVEDSSESVAAVQVATDRSFLCQRMSFGPVDFAIVAHAQAFQLAHVATDELDE